MKTSLREFLNEEFILVAYRKDQTWYTLDATTAWPQDKQETNRPQETYENTPK